jgi:hypothetical protein
MNLNTCLVFIFLGKSPGKINVVERFALTLSTNLCAFSVLVESILTLLLVIVCFPICSQPMQLSGIRNSYMFAICCNSGQVFIYAGRSVLMSTTTR